MTKPTVLLIDGDVICHIACKDKWHWLQKQRKVPSALWEKSPPKEGYELTDAEEIKYLRESWRHLEVHLQTLCEKLFITEYLAALKAPTNFRDDLYPDYKKHRKNKPNGNVTVQLLRDLWLEKDERAILAHGREADDYLRIWAKEVESVGGKYIIGSIDKDLRCIEGLHYNLKTNELTTVTPYDALKLYYEQLLKGDPTDNIPGLPRVGDIRAAEILSACTTEEEFQEEVILAYMNSYGDDWEDYLLSNGKMIHLQSNENDYFSLNNWPLACMLRANKVPKKILIKNEVTENPEETKTVMQVVASDDDGIGSLRLF